ncbi:MAG: carboxypeptidase regulatory-like domain-containing protein [Planctomycetes bacterium]|nr:carboxypeptidase regulatory-like domain-containing protein [Planctomycetota bacterium]
MSIQLSSSRSLFVQLGSFWWRALLAFVCSLSSLEAQDAPSLRLSGRCVAAEDEAPLAGLKLHWFVSSNPPREVSGETDAEGRFELGLGAALAEGEPSVFSISGGDRATRRLVVARPRVGEKHDLGTLHLARGVALRGKILDPAGAPIPGATLLIETETAHCDADGRFEFAAILPAGVRGSMAQAPGHQILQRQLRLPEDDGIELVLQPTQSITGRIVDLDDRPIAGVTVYADHASLPRAAISDADGRFELVDTLRQAPDTELHVLGGVTAPWRSGERFPWGMRDVRVQLERALEFDLEVVDRVSGAPVEDYAIHLLGNERPTVQSLRDAGRHPRGELRVTRVPHGQVHLWVVPASEELAPAEHIDVLAIGKRVPSVRVELERRPLIEVLVVDAAEQPVPGAKVALVRAPLARPFHVLDEPQRDEAGLFRSEADRPGLLDEEVCDEAGRAFVRDVPRRGQRFAGASSERGGVVFPKILLVVEAPGFARTIVEATRDPEQRVVLERGGRIEGRVVPAEALVLQPQLFLAGPGSDHEIHYRSVVRPPSMLELDADGRFAIEDLAPESYRIFGFLNGKREPLELASCELTAGVTASVVIELRDRLPGRLSARVADLPRGARLQIQRIEERRGSRSAMGIHHPGLDADGRLAPIALLPGTYELSLWLTPQLASSSGLDVYFLRRVELASGDDLTLDLRYGSRRLEIAASYADGAPPVEPRSAQAIEGTKTHAAIAEGGRLWFDPAPTSPFHLVIDGRRYPAPGQLYEAPSGESAWRIEVRLQR